MTLPEPYETSDEYLDSIGDDDDLDLHEADCGLTPDGLCQNAGTEWCEWSCPLNGERNAKRIRKMKGQGELDL